MNIKISNEITIEEPTQEIIDYCKKELVLDNPDFAKKERMGLWTGDTPRRLYLYRMDAGRCILPVGAFKSIKGLIDRLNIKTSYISDLARNEDVEYNASVNLYDYQKDALNAMLSAGYGILQSPAGSGKTQIGIALAIALGKKCLWLTHTRDLLKQSYDRAAQYIDKSLLGTITAGKVNIGKGITFATVQTLSKQDLTMYKYAFDVVIVDECHHVAGTPTAATMFSKVINSIAAPHKYGLSATVHRADKLIKTTYALLGDIKHIVPDEAVQDRVMQVEVQRIDTGFNILPESAQDTDGTIIYAKLINALCEDVGRCNIIADRLIQCREHYNLILSDRIQHLRDLYNLLPDELQERAAVIDGSMTTKKGKAARERAIEDMRAGKKHFLFASYGLAKEGLDIPRLDRLHLTTPQKDYAVIVQSVGRIARVFDGKQQRICYDYTDGIGTLERMYKKRKTSYRKCNCIIKK